MQVHFVRTTYRWCNGDEDVPREQESDALEQEYRFDSLRLIGILSRCVSGIRNQGRLVVHPWPLIIRQWFILGIHP